MMIFAGYVYAVALVFSVAFALALLRLIWRMGSKFSAEEALLDERLKRECKR